MITRLNSVSVPVTDQDCSLAFYRDALGFDVVMDTGGENFRWLTVAPRGSQTTLLLYKVTPDALTNSHDWAFRLGEHTGFVFYTDDIHKTYAELKEKGVKFLVEPKKLEWGGVEGTFVDPDGNQFELVETPKWS